MRKNLKADEKKELDRIVCEENALEHTRYGSVLDADRFAFPDRKTRLRLTGADPAGVPAFAAVYELGETYHGRPVREVSIFTDIRFRRKGLGTALLEKIRTPDAVLKFAEYESRSGDAFLKKCGAVHVYDELCMTVKTGAAQSGGEAFLQETPLSDGFRRMENEHSALMVAPYGEKAYICGVQTDAGMLRKGYAEKLLGAVLRKLSAEGTGEAILQVSGENIPAVKLYEKLGFVVTERLGMWYL